MSLTHEQAIALAVEHCLQQALDGLVVEIGDAGLDGKIMQCTDDFFRAVRQDGKIHRRMRRLHGFGELRHHGKCGRHHAEHQAADELALLALDLRQLLVQRLPAVENEMGPFQHALALRREPDIALAALDDGNAKLLLKLADAPGKRGLRDVASLRRPGEMLLARQRREVLNLTDVIGGRLAGKGREGKGEKFGG